jgi:hypothetical protein
MISYEQFEAECNRMDAELAAEQARQGKFIESLENALIELSIRHFPETEQHKHLFIKELTIKAHQEAVLLNECLDTLVSGYSSDAFELNTERVTIEANEREFVFLCYDKAKELIITYFPEIIDFSGNSIHDLDYSAYYQMEEWVCDFYYFAGEYINDRY